MEAAIIRFQRANEICCNETVSYPTMLILPNILFSTLQINIFFIVIQQNIDSINKYQFYKYILYFESIYFYCQYICFVFDEYTYCRTNIFILKKKKKIMANK